MLTQHEKSQRWKIDQQDPDNWLRIPEFGVMPGDVVFEGFAFPIVHPGAKYYELMQELREKVGRARRLAKRSFATLAELRSVYIDVLDAFVLDGTATTLKEADAARYSILMNEAEALAGVEDAITLISGMEKLEMDLAEWAEPMEQWFDRREAQADAAAAALINKFRRP